jgi:capsular polysaccharide biosynthesis protein
MPADDMLRLLRRQGVVIGVLTLVGLGASNAYVLTQAPQYRSTATVYVALAAASAPADLDQSFVRTQQLTSSVADLATSPFVLDPVIAELGLHTTASGLAAAISTPSNGAVITVSATDPSAARSTTIVNAVVARLGTSLKTLAPSTAEARPVRLTVVEPGRIPTAPASPAPLATLILGLLAGLGLGLLAGGLRERRVPTSGMPA